MRKLLIASSIALLTVALTVGLMLHFVAVHQASVSVDAPRTKKETAVTDVRSDVADTTPARATPEGASGGDEIIRDVSGPTLHGKVTDKEHKPLAEARVVVMAAGGMMKDAWDRSTLFRERLLGEDHKDRGGAVAEAVTDASGDYSIPLSSIPRGKHRVIASCEGYKPQDKSWEWTAESSELSFALRPGHAIVGVVLSVDHNPIPKAVIEAYKGGQETKKSAKPSAKDLVTRTESGGDGKFNLGVSGGKYRLVAYADGFSQKTLAAVSAGTEDLQIVLGAGYSLGGRVIDEQGSPIADAKLSIYAESAKQSKTFKNEVKSLARKGDPLVDDASPQSESQLAMMVFRLTESPKARTATDAEGHFELQGLAHGRYVLVAEKDGFEPLSSKAELLEKTKPTPIEMKLLRGHLLSGVVTDLSGKPVPGVFLAVSEAKTKSPPIDKAAGGARKKPLETGEKEPAPPKEGIDTNAVVKGKPKQKQKQPPLPKLLPSFRIEAAAQSDRDGRFQFNTLHKGTYVLKAQAEGFLSCQKDGLQVDAPLEVAVQLDAGIRLEGKVISNADGKPVSNARLRVDLGDMDRREAVSDAEGHYKLQGLAPGRIKQAELRAEGFSVSVIRDLQVAPSPAVQVLDLRLDASTTVSGIVTDSKGAPVPKARVVVAPVEDAAPKKAAAIERQQERTRAQTVQVRTDETGAFSLVGVSAGPAFRVTVAHADFKPFQSDPFSVQPGESIENLKYRLVSGARITVTVRDAQGAVSGARAKLTAQRPPDEPTPAPKGSSKQGKVYSILGLGKAETQQRRTATQASGADGKAVLSSLDGGEYLLSVIAKGHQPFTLPVFAVEDQNIAVAADLLPENVIIGVVQDSSGAAISGVRVSAQRPGESSEERARATSDKGGEFRVGNLGDGTYVLSARHEGFAERSISADAGGNVTIVLQRFGGIAGSVLAAETGEPITKFQVHWRDADAKSAFRFPGATGGGGNWQSAEKKSFDDPNGYFLLDGLRPGNYLLRVTAEDNAGTQVRATVREGTVTEGVRAQVQQGLSVIGFVGLNPALTPVSRARIYLLPRKGVAKSANDPGSPKDIKEAQRAKRKKLEEEKRLGIVHSVKSDAARLASLAAKIVEGNKSPLAVTDVDGSFRLKDIPVGSYHLIVDHDDLVPKVTEITVGDDGIAVEITVALDAGESLSGTVTLPDGSKAGGSLVFVKEATGLMKKAVTDETGQYFIQGLLQGIYELTVTAADSSSTVSGVKVQAGANHFDYKIGSRARGSTGGGVEKVSPH